MGMALLELLGFRQFTAGHQHAALAGTVLVDALGDVQASVPDHARDPDARHHQDQHPAEGPGDVPASFRRGRRSVIHGHPASLTSWSPDTYLTPGEPDSASGPWKNPPYGV